MARLVLSDASPLIVLARVSGMSWLRALFGEIVIPETVREEILDRGVWQGMEALHAMPDGCLFAPMAMKYLKSRNWTRARRPASDMRCATTAQP